MSKLDAAIRPFNETGYEIHDDAVADGKLVIWSVDPVTPRLGDLYLIESDGQPHDMEVVELVTFPGGWIATCREAFAPAR